MPAKRPATGHRIASFLLIAGCLPAFVACYLLLAASLPARAGAEEFDFYCGPQHTCTFVYRKAVSLADATSDCSDRGGWVLGVGDAATNGIVCSVLSKFTSNIGVLLGAAHGEGEHRRSWHWTSGPLANVTFATDDACASTDVFCNLPLVSGPGGARAFKRGISADHLYFNVASCDWRKMERPVNGFVCQRRGQYDCGHEMSREHGCKCLKPSAAACRGRAAVGSTERLVPCCDIVHTQHAPSNFWRDVTELVASFIVAYGPYCGVMLLAMYLCPPDKDRKGGKGGGRESGGGGGGCGGGGCGG